MRFFPLFAVLCTMLCTALPALGQSASGDDVAVLEAEISALRARLERLEKRVEACETKAEEPAPIKVGTTSEPAGPEPAERFEADPLSPADPADVAPVRAERAPKIKLAHTGQTLADKVRFLENNCRQISPCTNQLLAKKALLRTMTIDQVRRYSSSVTRCAHSCAVDLAVQEAAEESPHAPAPDEAVGLRPAGQRGLPGYPGADAPLEELQRFLDVRCGDLHCARLPLRARAKGNPAMETFVRTCAQACADTRSLSPGE